MIGELKSASRRREEDARRMSDEVRGLKDLIPKAMEGQKETTDSRLRELNNELKSLKTLMGQRLNPQTNSTPTSYGPTGRPSSAQQSTTSAANSSNGSSSADNATPKTASVSNGGGAEPSTTSGRSSPFGTGLPAGKAAIPAWQLAASNKTSTNDSSSNRSSSVSQEASKAS